MSNDTATLAKRLEDHAAGKAARQGLTGEAAANYALGYLGAYLATVLRHVPPYYLASIGRRLDAYEAAEARKCSCASGAYGDPCPVHDPQPAITPP